MVTVLIVDNEPVIVDVLAAALEDDGYDVITAFHGAHALKKLEDNPHAQLVISDFIMPVLDGAGLLRAMRVHPIRGKTPFILMSSFPEAYVRRYIIGHHGFIWKPFVLADVLKLVAEVLGVARPKIH